MLCAITSGILNRLAKLTSQKPFIHSEGVDKIYPNHAYALRKAGLAPHNFPTMVDLWSKQGEKVDIEKEPDVNKKKHKCILLCFLLTLFFYVYHQGDIQAKNNFNLFWLIFRMSHHIFNNFAELLNKYLAEKIGQGILPKYLMAR